jgi:very-short-patch-repair endonuclease
MPDRSEVPEDLRRQMVEVAKYFRKEPTPTEGILWQALRGRKLDGVKFRRQQNIGPFVVDFFAAEQRLIVEVDGPIHDSQQRADQARQEILESLGLRFVRVRTETVERNLAAAVAAIRAELFPHPPAPSPKMGEGEIA